MFEVAAFLGLVLICDPNQPDTCAIVRSGKFFNTYDACANDLATNGLKFVLDQYGDEVHLAFFDCLEVNLEGEPA